MKKTWEAIAVPLKGLLTKFMSSKLMTLLLSKLAGPLGWVASPIINKYTKRFVTWVFNEGKKAYSLMIHRKKGKKTDEAKTEQEWSQAVDEQFK